VNQAGIVCANPPAPVLSAPAQAFSGSPYTVTWTATSPDNTYEGQESTDPSFAGAPILATRGTRFRPLHNVTEATTYYSRIRATATCGATTYTSAWSNVEATVVNPVPSGDSLYVPAAAHASGLAGTNWKTDLEVHNPGTTQARFTLELLRKDLDNSSPQTVSFTLDGGTSRRFGDVLFDPGVGLGYSGAATLKVTPWIGSVMVTSRTYNDQALGTSGQFVPGQPDEATIARRHEARLIGLSQSMSPAIGYRTNLGLVNATDTAIWIEVKLYKADGTYLGTLTYFLPPYGFNQLGGIFKLVTDQDVTDGYAVLRATTSSGAFFAYASVIDNRSGDPIYIPARVVQ
jgi:hypothetical protein